MKLSRKLQKVDDHFQNRLTGTINEQLSRGSGAAFGELRRWTHRKVQNRIEVASAEARRTCPASFTAIMETETNGDAYNAKTSSI
jgi:hypothetical protein